MWRKKCFLVLIFCILTILWSGCSSLKLRDSKSDKTETAIGNAKVFVESFPPQRPEWVNSVPVSDESLFFIGVSSYLANETTARDGARNDALNQVVKYYGTIIQAKAQETKASKNFSSEIINPYIEQEEIIQSFAQRYVSEILPENYYIEKYLTSRNQEQYICYVKCSVSKEKVKREMDSFAKEISERYSSLLPENNGKSSSLKSDVENCIAVYKAVSENPLYKAVAFVEASGGKAALDEYALLYAKKIIQNCKIQNESYPKAVEKGSEFLSVLQVHSDEYKNLSSLKAEATLFNNEKSFGAALYEINSENKIKISGNTQSLNYGSYSLKVRLVSDIEKNFLGEITADSTVLNFEVTPVYAGLEFKYSENMCSNANIEQKMQSKLQKMIEEYGIPVFIDKSGEKEKTWNFVIFIDREKLASHEAVTKTKVLCNVALEKNGVAQVQGESFFGMGLSSNEEKSLAAAFEKAWRSFVLDKEFFEKVKNQFVEKNQEEEN
ncbi:hypothetical protein [uncultured Treponema sp.]|uniref:hypothetical protein n=1 Tax=uncultured Treponema sp. TaxID=162155 RepID=UPI0025927DE7|nr:hypothetical protein [uncultured Treponema sp.]